MKCYALSPYCDGKKLGSGCVIIFRSPATDDAATELARLKLWSMTPPPVKPRHRSQLVFVLFFIDTGEMLTGPREVVCFDALDVTVWWEAPQ